MITDQDTKKLIKEFKKVFPTAKMIKDSFDNVPTKAQFERLEVKVDKIDERLKNVEVTLEGMQDLRPRVKRLEEALEIE